MIDRAAILAEIYQRNAMRRQAMLPLLNVQEEFNHLCALARKRDYDAFCATKQADFDRIEAEVLVEMRARHGPQFPSNTFSRMGLRSEVNKRFRALIELEYGVRNPGDTTRHEIIYGGGRPSD